MSVQSCSPIVSPKPPTPCIATAPSALPKLLLSLFGGPKSPPANAAAPPPTAAKGLDDAARSSDSGKSSSCSPTLLDCSFDSGIAGVVLDGGAMQLHKRIQECQRVLLALERERDHFCAIRNRLSKISERKQKKNTSDSDCVCNVCCAEINPDDEKTFVKCHACQKPICRSIKCADWLAKSAQWECELCQTSKESLAQTSSWVAEQLSFNQQKLVYPMRARSEIFIPINECADSSLHFESVSQIGGNSAQMTAEQRLKIREYVEEIVAGLLGGSNLDTIAVNQLSKSENYLPAPKANGHLYAAPGNGSALVASSSHHNDDVAGNTAHSRESTPGPDFTDISEARLRTMIQKIIAETVDMPPLSKTHAVSEISLDRPSKRPETVAGLNNGRRHRTEHYFEPANYQDLLATAVLNKIVDKQINNGNRNISESSPDLSRASIEGRTTAEGEEDALLDQNYNLENRSTTSGSSLEPRSECSYTDTDQIVNTIDGKSSDFLVEAGRDSAISDYIAAHMVPLPDISTMGTESEEDDYASVTSSAIGDSTWENNWLFKKKKSTISGSVTGSSVGMLVPDPKEDVRAQIGDKTADEISDLSELGSDTDDSSLELLRTKIDPINDRLLNKHIIGGQNSKMVLDELIERSSMISQTVPMEQEELYTETLNENVDSAQRNEAINEDVMQLPSDNNNHEEQKNMEDLLPPQGFEDASGNPLSGSIAEREYKKWYNAVEMPNNPYAPEALKRRISGSQERFIDLPNISPTTEQCQMDLIGKEQIDIDGNDKRESEYRRYSRDYYINNGSQSPLSPTRDHQPPVAAKETLESEQIPPAEVANDKNNTTDASAKEAEIRPSAAIDLYKATPAQVVEDTASSLDTISQQSMQSNATTTSEDSDTIKIYNFKKQETTIISRENNRQEQGSQVPQQPEAAPGTKERPTVLNLQDTTTSTSASSAIGNTPTRGSTPTAFKFLQPKRRLLDPSQVLSIDEDETFVTASMEKPVIEKEVVQSLPSVKALAKAFLMTSSSVQHLKAERLWPRKAKTLPEGAKAPLSPVKVKDAPIAAEEKSEEDVTITSDLSSLETDPMSASKASAEQTKDPNSQNTPATALDAPASIPIRQGGLRSNIAFFENLKNVK